MLRGNTLRNPCNRANMLTLEIPPQCAFRPIVNHKKEAEPLRMIMDRTAVLQKRRGGTQATSI